MGTPFTIDDAFVLEGEEEGVVPGEDVGDWKGREKDGGGEMTFGPLSFAKTQTSGPAGTPEHSNLKYQVRCLHVPCFLFESVLHANVTEIYYPQNLENEDVLGGTVNSSFNNFFKIRFGSSHF